ncbi:Pentatricopeptide repeat-containing protein At3g42630 [Linum perenne]
MAAANLNPFYRLPDLAPNSCINPSPSSSSYSSSFYGTVKALQSRRCCNNSTSRHSSETHQAESVSTLLKSQMRKHPKIYPSEVSSVNCESLIQNLRKERLPHVAHELFLEMRSQGFLPDNSTLSALMLCYADNGLFPHAQSIWDEILNSSFTPSISVVSELMDAYSKMGFYDEVAKLVDQLSSRHREMLPEVYAMAISCFGKGGQLGLMENAMKEMVSKGVRVSSSMGNSFIIYYSIHGSLTEMEAAYHRVKRSRVLVEEEAIRAVSSAYIRNRKYYQLGEFVKDVGLKRRNVGNLLWNLLLLSYATKFKMKSLQREFINMVESGFCPDITTFNIRAIAFSKMSLLWDLHLTLEHMGHVKVDPDLVTYGCVVDAYMERRLARNLEFAFRKLNLDESPVVLTDPFVFDVLGKGDFHVSSEAFMEYRTRKRDWSYKDLVAIYVRKQHRSNQIFWNY